MTIAEKLVFKTDYHLMKVKSITAILSSFIKLPFVIKIFVLSTFEWRLKTDVTETHITLLYSLYVFCNSTKQLPSC